MSFFLSNNPLEKREREGGEERNFLSSFFFCLNILSSVPCNRMDVNGDMYGSDKNSFIESSYQVTENQSIPVYADVQTYPCSNCGRCFNVESLVDIDQHSISFELLCSIA